MNRTATNETVITVTLAALAVYFTALVALSLVRYLAFRRVSRTATLTWRQPRSRVQRMLPLLGVVSAVAAVLNAASARPLHHVYSQLIMAIYFLGIVPLLARIPVGLYRDGILADRGFLPWGQIARLAFQETPEIVLLLVQRGRGRALYRLPVPGSEYGAVRRVLAEKLRENQVHFDQPILGLGSTPSV